MGKLTAFVSLSSRAPSPLFHGKPYFPPHRALMAVPGLGGAPACCPSAASSAKGLGGQPQSELWSQSSA